MRVKPGQLAAPGIHGRGLLPVPGVTQSTNFLIYQGDPVRRHG